jgi:flagellar biogenesis protein FliO
MMSRSPWMALICLGSLTTNGLALAPSRPAVKPAFSSFPAESGAPAAVEPNPWDSPEIAAPQLEDDLIRRPSAARGTNSRSSQGSGAVGSLVRTSASLAGVVALIVLLAWGYRAASGAGNRFGSRWRGAEPGLIQVLHRTSIGPRQGLGLVRVGPQLVLLGTTHDSIRALTVVQDADLAARVAGQRPQANGQRAEFQACLETESRAYTEPAPAAAGQDAPGLGEVKHKLSQALRRMEKLAAAGA